MAKKQAKVQTVSTQQKWLFKGIVFLGMLLMTIGIFGAILIYKSGNNSQALNFIEYFKTIQEIIKAGGATSTSMSVAETNSYCCIALFFFAILITLLPTLIMLLKKKSNINVKKAFAFASVGSLLFMFANTIFWSQSACIEIMGYKVAEVTTAFGWGSILIIVGFVIGVVGLILHELIASKSFITLRNIFAKAGLVLMFFISLFSMFSVSLSENGSNLSVSLFQAIALDGTKSSAEQSSAVGIGAFALILSLASMVFFALTLYKFIFNNPKKRGNSVIVFSSIYWFTALLSNILVMNYVSILASEHKLAFPYFTNPSIALSSGAIVQIVLGLCLVVAAILTRIFRRTDREAI